MVRARAAAILDGHALQVAAALHADAAAPARGNIAAVLAAPMFHRRRRASGCVPQTLNRYPMPDSVSRYLGRDGSGSSLRRSWAR